MRPLIVSVALLTSCSPLFERSMPGLPGARYDAPADGHCGAGVAFVLFAFALAWQQQEPTTDFPAALADFHVEALPEPWPLAGGLAMGQTLAPTHVRYSLRREPGDEVLPLDQTALTHELVNAALWTDLGDPDASHESPLFGAWHDDLDERIGAAQTAMGLCDD